MAVLAVGCYVAVRRLVPVIGPTLAGSGCQASTGQQRVLLDTQQASIAATIAGVAHRQSMPRDAVTVAYATAMQESKLHNLDYGDLDSVGVFQQRPSEGWGPRGKLEDPVYATTKFFRALRAVPHYQRLPVYQAAQAVQRSADGTAYMQYENMAAEMSAAFTGERRHAVYCWWSSAAPRRAAPSAITRELAVTFGPAVAGGATTSGRSGLLLPAERPKAGWVMATWLVTHASRYGIHEISFGGYYWRATAGAKGWRRDPGPLPLNAIKVS